MKRPYTKEEEVEIKKEWIPEGCKKVDLSEPGLIRLVNLIMKKEIKDVLEISGLDTQLSFTPHC
jgi:hypothetical protein